MKLKELEYKSIDELERQLDQKKLLLQPKDADGHDLILRFGKIHEKLQSNENKNDQEAIYLKYYALVTLYNEIKRSKINEKDSIYCNLMISKEKIDECTEQCNKLRQILIERYKGLLDFNGTRQSTGLYQTILPVETHITCQELYDLIHRLCTKDSYLLLIDLRRKVDYDNSSIRLVDERLASALITINIPEDKISNGFTCLDIESLLNSSELGQFRKRNEAHTVVLMDYEATSLKVNQKLFIFHQALTKFDTTPNRLRVPPRLLKGGFDEWIITYPMHCTDLSAQFTSDRQLDNERTNHQNDLNMNQLNVSRLNEDDMIERIYSKDREKHKSIPGSAQFIKPPVNNFLKNSSLFSNFTNNFARPNSFLTDDEDSQSRDKKVIYHKIYCENDESTAATSRYLSKRISDFKNELPQPSDSSDSFEVPSIFSSSLSNRRSKSYTNLNKINDVPPDDEEESTFSNRPNFDRSSKPNGLLNDITNRPSLSSNYREFSPIYSTGSQPTGLKNLGNTCFMNAVIQCLFNVTHFSDYFIGKNYLSDINRNSKFGTRGELTEEFGELMIRMNDPSYKHISPKDFRRIVGKHISAYSGCEQQDSHEFLLILFEKLHADLNKSRLAKTNIEIPDTLSSKEATEQFWKDHLANNCSVISNLFEGLIMSSLECETCEKESNTFEVFTCLSLPIPNNSSNCALNGCLQEFTKNEKMCDETAWQCPKCKVKRSANKRTIIVKLPKILIIHLKRFSFEGRWKQKINTFVDFQMKNLSLRHFSYFSNESSNLSYNLIGVVDHTGSLEGGHYTAICKSNAGIDKWNKYDDQDVYDISPSEVVSSKAYLLFYLQSD